ncbi:IclR family transcriptional regulator [Aliidongia dinghuensis]|uniref:IclR family transcriptional regulator n=1 Tax=Aliidongia dinghuensis TaxID=1867774 RepID=A0A8J2YR04_9PROT|nr:IclR family transcriptional regulator [Aliidongia dinghuensis]GGF10466.1 IclR family transcriptional regulator [Aliidongia dinghuensis]
MKLEQAAAVKSADRAFDILEFVGDAPRPPSFSQLLAGLGIPRSSLFHLLNTLVARGYLVQVEAGGGYGLGPGVRRLADRLSGPSPAALAEPFLRKLGAELNETAGFYVRVGDQVEVVATVAGTQALAYTMQLGERAPLYAVSAGKILLAHASAEDLAAYLARTVFDPITPATLPAAATLQDQLRAARTEGFAYSRDEFTPGITGVATLVAHEGRPFGAINLAVPSVRFTSDREAAFCRELRSVAAMLGQTLAQARRAG